MKKLIAALLVLTMVLALTGTAMASCSIKVSDHVRFTKNTVAYSNHYDRDDTSTIVRRGSIALVVDTFGDNWVELLMNPTDLTKTCWIKVDNLKVVKNPSDYITVVFVAGVPVFTTDIYVTYSNGGVKGSNVLLGYDNLVDDIFTEYKKVKATGKVWLHKEASLSKNYGAALHKDDVVKYRHRIGFDDRFVGYYGVKYMGKCLWVSSQYSKLVK